MVILGAVIGIAGLVGVICLRHADCGPIRLLFGILTVAGLFGCLGNNMESPEIEYRRLSAADRLLTVRAEILRRTSDPKSARPEAAAAKWIWEFRDDKLLEEERVLSGLLSTSERISAVNPADKFSDTPGELAKKLAFLEKSSDGRKEEAVARAAAGMSRIELDMYAKLLRERSAELERFAADIEEENKEETK